MAHLGDLHVKEFTILSEWLRRLLATKQARALDKVQANVSPDAARTWWQARPLQRRRSAPSAQGFEARVLEGGARTLLGRRIPFIQTEVGPAMMAGVGSNATAYLERFVQVSRVRTCYGLTWQAQWRQPNACDPMVCT